MIWQHVRVAAYADQGRTLYEQFGTWEIVSNTGLEQGHYGGMDEWRKNDGIAQAGFHQAMFDWLENENNVPGTDFKQSLHEWSVVLALYQSVLEHRPVSLTEFDPPDDLFENIKKLLFV